MLPNTYLVCPPGENHGHQQIETPEWVQTYSDKLQYILDDGMGDGSDQCCILDDDLVFSRRYTNPKGNPGLQTCRTEEELETVNVGFSLMERLLLDTALVGIHPRQMGHTQPTPYVENGKIICIQGINRKLIGKMKINQYPILADVILNATLLSHGQGNKIVTTICQDHGSCQAPGGCSLYRTPGMQAEACYYLEERFGPYIKAKIKEAKDGWLGGKRVDFTGQWKRLYAAGASGVLDTGTGENTDAEILWQTTALDRRQYFSDHILLQREAGE